MANKSLLKILLKPTNFNARMCSCRGVDEATNKINILLCPFVDENRSYCSWFGEEIVKTKYETWFRCDMCNKSLGFAPRNRDSDLYL